MASSSGMKASSSTAWGRWVRSASSAAAPFFSHTCTSTPLASRAALQAAVQPAPVSVIRNLIGSIFLLLQIVYFP